MTEAKTTLLVDELDPHHAYTIATGLVVPRPVGWIGTRSADGVNNVAPYSFFNVVAGYPPTFVFSAGRGKDTLVNAVATGVFTVSIVSEHVAEAMNASSASVDASVDEFALAGITAVDGDLVAAPWVGEAKASFECRVAQTVDVGAAGGDGKSSNVMVIGECLCLHVDEAIIDGHHIDAEGLAAIGRHAGGTYSRTSTTLFEMTRPA